MSQLFKSLGGVTSISFSDIFGGSNGELSLEKLEGLLDRLLEEESAKQNTDPNQLIRIVHEGEVIWVTSAQAKEFLNEATSEGEEAKLRMNVERALKGDRRILQQELLLILAFATSTFERYRTDERLSKETIERIEPALSRREQEIGTTFRQLEQVEAKIESYRNRYPILGEYEKRMGELLNAQQKGDIATARNIAVDLAKGKKEYVLMTRALQPDINEAYFHRLQSQKIKKKILNTQQGLVSGRGTNLRIEIADLQQQMKGIKAEAGLGNVDPLSARNQLIQARDSIQDRVKELETIVQESKVIAMKEAETDAVISHIAANVLGDTELSVDVEKQVQRVENKRTMTKTHSPSPTRQSKGTGMATSHRHRT